MGSSPLDNMNYITSCVVCQYLLQFFSRPGKKWQLFDTAKRHLVKSCGKGASLRDCSLLFVLVFTSDDLRESCYALVQYSQPTLYLYYTP
jgi:hypothetical protein